MRKRTLEKKADVRNGVKRLFYCALAILLQIILIILMFTRLDQNAEWVHGITLGLALVAVLGIYSQNKTAAMKTPWIILIMLFPLMGLVMYLLIGLSGSTWKMRKRYEAIDAKLLPLLSEGPEKSRREACWQTLAEENPQIAGISRYLIDKSGYPVYQNTDVEYYDDGLKGLNAQKEALQQAKHFIFMEYHAIEDAESWHEIQEILEERVKAGVEVRVFYDDLGSIGFITTDFIRRLEAVGIACRVFNPVAPGLNFFLNNRDHRKITVIDGRVGFTGGYNLANEYFNRTSPYGHWKDTGIRLTGEAVRNLTVTFLENWNAVRDDDKDDTNLRKYLPPVSYTAEENGFVQPYGDLPLDNEHVGEEVYISMAEKATRYCWFITPYLILTDEIIHALGLAAKRGVDVRVITPGIPDKKIVYQVTRSYYNALTRNGVKVYEYTPGFCHCKMCVIDDVAAVCGTINLDYRSLYHHFENGCLYVNCRAVRETRQDFEQTMKLCRDVTEEYTTGRSHALRIGQMILRLIAPLL
ncbi:MAG: cardiolipin synthase [Lachnospiraceae bacterium]|nr:cardiolipin synthase [Lachnospiraceae bacterium]